MTSFGPQPIDVMAASALQATDDHGHRYMLIFIVVSVSFPCKCAIKGCSVHAGLLKTESNMIYTALSLQDGFLVPEIPK